MAQHISFIILITVMVSLPQSFAPWSEGNVYIPPPGTTLTCAIWITNSGFENFSTEVSAQQNKERDLTTAVNIKLAKKRDRNLDDIVSIWAVLYAHILLAFPNVISNFNSYYYKPNKFCNDRQLAENILPFETFANFERTCEEWLQLYGYVNDVELNWRIAFYRNQFEDNSISLWAAGYSLYIERLEKESTISIFSYCNAVAHRGKKMHFMSLGEAKMPCQEWVKISGYTDNVTNNFEMAKNKRFEFIEFEFAMNSSTRHYVIHLFNSNYEDIYQASTWWNLFRSSGENTGLKEPHTGSSSSSLFIPNLNDEPRTPLDFCTFVGYPDSNPVRYYW